MNIRNTQKFLKIFWSIVAAPFALLLLLLLLIRIGVFGKLPTFEDLENPKSNIATEVISEDGRQLGSYFIQNRSFVDYGDLSPSLVAALVATEDERFYNHSGIDFISLMRVAVKTVGMGNLGQGGGSTISQQLAKNLYPRDTATYSSVFTKAPMLVIAKLKEWITAVMLEHNYTKDEIAVMYLNVVEYGSNAYGIKSAAHTYFNKTPGELTIEEAAMLVGVVNKPTRYNPARNPDFALARRNTVISRMYTSGFLKRHERDSISKIPIMLDYHPISHNEGTSTYFREMLRLFMTANEPKRSSYNNDWDYQQDVKLWNENPLYGWCHKNTKADGTVYNLYKDGLKIYTTVNSKMQAYAEEAVAQHMGTELQPRFDADIKRRQGRNIFSGLTKEEVERIMTSAMKQTDRYRNGKRRGLSEAEILKDFNTPVEMNVFSYKDPRGIDTLMTPYDSILYNKSIMRAGFVAMDPATGHVKAYVGGNNFKYFKYDMVRQGKRQAGSTIKPFIYTFAIDHLGFSPCEMVPNLPITLEGGNGESWSPKESSTVEYTGELKPLWWGMANSRNNYSAWIMKQAKRPEAVADFVHRLGIHSYIDPVYAMCLGTPDVTLLEMVGAYADYANRGVHNEPVFVTRIEDRHGNILATFIPQSYDAISERTAYNMIGMLKRVVTNGTAGRLRWRYGFTKGEIGGKTGTTQKNSDAWFIGLIPKLVAGVWVGGEDRSIHLTYGGEGAASALPIYAIFLQKVYADKSLGIPETDAFIKPAGMYDFDCPSDTGILRSNWDEEDEDEFFR